MRQRRGITERTAKKLLLDPIYFGMMMLRNGQTDGLVAGTSLNYQDTIRPALRIIGLQPETRVTAGMYMILQRDRTVFFADTTVNITPDADTLAEIALLTATEVAHLGFTPRVAMVSFSNFGSSTHPLAQKVRQATEIVRNRAPHLSIDGEMQIDPALDPDLAHAEFPFSEIQGDANILVFPSLESANVAYKLMTRLGEAEAIGPILLGMNKPVNVLSRGCSSEDVFNMAAYTVAQTRETTT
jgi:malate dehydrogenase (oxaloacetate-decarboxylating)(NADP+)